MPEMDGIEAAKHIRDWEKQRFKDKFVPIIALTANAVLGMREMFLEQGFDDFLAKPIDISKLDEVLDRWIPAEKRKHGTEGETVSVSSSSGTGGLGLMNIPGVDAQQGIAMTGGTEKGYKRVLTVFRRDAHERLPFLEETPTAESLPNFIIQVHALKSASASVGALEISAQAGKLETAGRNTDMTYIHDNLGGFVEQLKELINNINAALEAEESAPTPAAGDAAPFEKPKNAAKMTGEFEQMLPLFQKLKTELKSQNLTEIDRLLNEINGKPMDENTRHVLEVISDDVLMTEFDHAIKNIEELTNIYK